MKIQRPGMSPGIKSQNSGAALIIALCFLVILTGIMLALYSSTRSDLINSKVFAGGQATTLLTDTAVNIVEGQITAASTQSLVSWASQPGMIHAYSNNSTTGTHTAYKLYSSDAMVMSPWSQTTMNNETTAMEGWKATTDTTTSYNAMWCDLNAPAVVNRTVPGNTTASTLTPVFPIVDPGAMMISGSGVQGFGFSTAVPGTSVPATATDPTRRLAMPVKWIYILKSGQLIAPSSLSGSTAAFTGSVTPTSTNPIIGRIAFWADDDTCKLNINTASEGSFWDMPRANLPSEWYLAYTLPVLDEFQAISGHPATTCLDPVFGDLLPRPTFTDVSLSLSGSGTLTVTPNSGGSYSQLQAYYALNPRISDTAVLYNPFSPSTAPTATTTSQAGTVSTTRTDNSTTDLVPTVLYKSDRLYATPDELLFNPNRGFNPTWSTNTVTTATLTAATLAQRDFFITAQSRAPETTLFGTPRFCMWPIQQATSTGTYQSARDQLIAFCATTGTGSSPATYYFQRGQVSLLGTGNSTPTAQANPASASISADWGIARNKSLFTYATSMMETAVPGFGSSLASKWGQPYGCERVMTMALDMIRSGLSQVGTTSSATPQYWCYRDDIQIAGVSAGIRGSVIPLQVTTSNGTYNGIGRCWRVCSAAIQVIPTSRTPKPGNTSTTSDGWTTADPMPPTTGIQAILLLNFYNPMPTPQIVEPSFRINVSNSTVGINGNPIGGGTVLVQDGIGGNGIFYRNFAFPGFAGLLYEAQQSSGGGTLMRTFNPGTGNVNSDPINNYPYETAPVPVAQTGTVTTTPNFTINGGAITIQIMEGGATSNVVQTETLNFPSWTGPLPQIVNLNSNSGATTGQLNPTSPPIFANRAPTSTSGSSSWFQPGDIVREVQFNPNSSATGTVTAGGDYRLLTVASNIPSSWFTPNVSYTGSVTTFTTPDTSTVTLTQVQDEVNSMQNRFAFAFQESLFGYTYGVGNGYDSPLAQSYRWGSTACTGLGWAGTGSPNNYGNNSWNYSQNYTVAPGGLVSNLRFLVDSNAGSGLKPSSSQNMQPVIPPAAPAAINPTPLGAAITPPNNGWAPTNTAGAGDWTTDYALVADGAIFSAPDSATWETVSGNNAVFFTGQAGWCKTPQEAVTEPNRVVASPVGIFGSLPTPTGTATAISGDGYGQDLQPWQSMLFCPNPAAGNSHPGFGNGGTGTVTIGPMAQPPFSTSPPDHLFNDLFWMPVVEPYAISDSLSTAGKVNLNYEMEPFTHITRRTALVGVLTPVEIGAINNATSYMYKSTSTGPSFLGSTNTLTTLNTRFPLNLDTGVVPGGTPPTSSTAASGCFTDFENRFSSGDVFRSASEACMIRLVPSGQTASTLSNWWSNYQLTGLNMRESPYNQIYSRITTKSNTYTVHYWVQSLQQVSTAGHNYAQWNENQDIKTGEYRGNTTIERYLDPDTPNLPDYTTVSLTGSYTPIDQYYSWRVVMQKQFAPGSN